MQLSSLKSLARAGVVMASVLTLVGCGTLLSSPSPTSTYLDDSGETVTVDWVNYPAHAGNDGAAFLGYPDQMQLELTARELLDALSASIDDTLGVQMAATDLERDWFADDNWFVQEGNGYGGDSLLVTVNCCELSAERSVSLDERQRLLDEASQVAVTAGLGPFAREAASDFCADNGDQCWFWSASATDGVQWV